MEHTGVKGAEGWREGSKKWIMCRKTD